MPQSRWNVVLLAVMGAYLVVQGYLVADLSASNHRLERAVAELQTRVAALQGGAGPVNAGGGLAASAAGPDGARTSTDADGADRPRNKPPLPAGSSPGASSWKPHLNRPATVMVKLLARMIVLEYRADTSLTDAQTTSSKSLLTAFRDQQASDVQTEEKFNALLTDAQRAYLDKELGQVELKTRELLEISGKDDAGYADLALEFLDKPIRPDTTGK